MKYGNVPGIDKKISRLVQGSTPLGGLGQEKSFELLDKAYELGCRAIDSAAVYGEANEAAVGEWINARGVRDDMVILAKGAHHDANGDRVTPEDIAFDIDLTMGRMNVDHLDLYVLHRDDPKVDVGPIVEALNEHVEAGRISAFGGSNWHWDRIKEANEYAEAKGLIPFAVSSPNFSMADQLDEPWANCISISGKQGEAARAWYKSQNMPLFTWSTLAGGFWSGRFTRETQDSDDFNELVKRCYASEDNFTRLDRAMELASAKGASVPQIALSFVLNSGLNTFTLIAPVNPDEFADCAKAVELELTPEEVEYLDLKRDTV